MKLKAFLASVIKGAGQMLLPDGITCYACGGELDGTTEHQLCGDCALEFNHHFCNRCGQKIADLAEFCDRCIGYGKYNFDLARSAVVFNQTAQRLIHAFKYGDAIYLADYMANFMVHTALQNDLLADWITFVPLHKKRKRKRGYNQSELLANALSRLTKIPLLTALQKTRHTKNLARLNRQERLQMIAGTFVSNGEASQLNGKSILLVDDVLTTGATVDECAKVLKASGAATVTVLTFASVYTGKSFQFQSRTEGT